MSSVFPKVDPDGLLEFSVVFTDRSLNHMSQEFQRVMRDIYATLNDVYQADNTVVVPGSGTFAMEAVVRQFAERKKCLVIRNGLFSFRWTQIFEAGNIPAESIVLKAAPVEEGENASYAPCPIEKATAVIREEKPDVVFAPHVETSAGMIIPDDYIASLAEAVHEYGGCLVLDCIASGTIWVDMKKTGVDVLVSAPQKGWSGTPCCGFVMMNERAAALMEKTQSSSFACDLKKWHTIMQAYVNGGHAYHATMPTDSLKQFRDVMMETKSLGFDLVKERQWELGRQVRKMMADMGIKSLAAAGFEAPGVVVSYTDDTAIAGKFIAAGAQIAAGVPIKCDEPEGFSTYRIGLFGLDKLMNVAGTIETLQGILTQVYG